MPAGDAGNQAHLRIETASPEGGSKEGRLPGARCLGSPTGGWKPPLLQPTAGSVNSEMHPRQLGVNPEMPLIRLANKIPF